MDSMMTSVKTKTNVNASRNRKISSFFATGVFVAICSLVVFPLIAGYFYAKYIGKKVTADDEANCNDMSLIENYK